MKYEIIPTFRGYKIRKPHGKHYLYVSKVYKGKYNFVTDHAHAKTFNIKTAKKHLKILQEEIKQ